MADSGLIVRVGQLYSIRHVGVGPFMVKYIAMENDTTKVVLSPCKIEENFAIDILRTIEVALETHHILQYNDKSNLVIKKKVKDFGNFCLNESRRESDKCRMDLEYVTLVRKHSLAAALHSSIQSNIMNNASRPPKPLSLGPIMYGIDSHILGICYLNDYRRKLTLDEFDDLDRLTGSGWDIKPLREGVPGSFFKFIDTLSIYLDKATDVVRVSFTYRESVFPVCTDYRKKCTEILKSKQQ